MYAYQYCAPRKVLLKRVYKVPECGQNIGRYTRTNYYTLKDVIINIIDDESSTASDDSQAP